MSLYGYFCYLTSPLRPMLSGLPAIARLCLPVYTCSDAHTARRPGNSLLSSSGCFYGITQLLPRIPFTIEWMRNQNN